jgi:L-asparaginase II
VTYPRSSLKPFQTRATLTLLDAAGVSLSREAIAIASASHAGADDHQIEAAHLLALADLDETALQCPPAWAADDAVRGGQQRPEALAHNCSGKHAAFLLAHTTQGGDPAYYLDAGSAIQREVLTALTDCCGVRPSGPGVDGCGAPAWRMPLSALATGFARLAAATHGLERVRDAMRAFPYLVGGATIADTKLMQADGRVVAKRGAEAVMAVGFASRSGPVGIAVKIADGHSRADSPVAACVLERFGAVVPEAVRRPAVIGGGNPRGALETVFEL